MADSHRYLLALGSNVRHHRHGNPSGVLQAALGQLDSGEIAVERFSEIFRTVPVGHSRRQFANACTVVSTALPPGDLLAWLKSMERGFGRKRVLRKWGARVLDLDIILWDGGTWASTALVVPHASFRERDFVLRPAAAIAPRWRDPVTGLNLRQLLARLTRRRPAPR